MKNTYIEKYAALSEDGVYRYLLTRVWDKALPTMLFVMINPSIDDALVDYPTIRKCVGFAKKHGFGSIKILNLFAHRSKNPKDLWTVKDPVGPDYWGFFFNTLDSVKPKDRVVLAWGCDDVIRRKERLKAHMETVRLRLAVYVPMCLGLTQGGAPKHPVMLPYNTPLQTYQYEDLPCPITQ